MIAAVTGHRPKDLFGYDLMNKNWSAVRAAIKRVLLEQGVTELYTGMALGTDQLAALAVLDLRDRGHAIRLHAAIPCRGHAGNWPEKSRMLYEAILSKCDEITLVTDASYSPNLMQVRNRFMVDNSDMVIAVYKNTPGGTRNCVEYAKKKNRPIWLIPPARPEDAGWADP